MSKKPVKSESFVVKGAVDKTKGASKVGGDDEKGKPNCSGKCRKHRPATHRPNMGGSSAVTLQEMLDSAGKFMARWQREHPEK